MTINQWLVLLAGAVGLVAAGYEVWHRFRRWKQNPEELNELDLDRMVRLAIVFAVLVASIWLGMPDIFGT